jgi:hypothetical protein
MRGGGVYFCKRTLISCCFVILEATLLNLQIMSLKEFNIEVKIITH